jgi:L-aminopeptidase/D-esterase-like protein
MLAFSTANPGAATADPIARIEMLANSRINPLFDATIQSTEEAIVNALVAAETMRGIDDLVVTALPHDRLREAMARYRRRD